MSLVNTGQFKMPPGLRLDTSDALMITSGGYANRQILYVNAAFERLTGFNSKEWLGRSGDLLLADGPLRMESLLWLDAAEDGTEVHWIARMHRRDGTPFAAEAHLYPVAARESGAGHVVVVITDVTSRLGVGKARRQPSTQPYSALKVPA
jgi:PAS domain S-box-containing protein